jgi:folate-dependent tRNA-U54 methylase TrmFO/GidA
VHKSALNKTAFLLLILAIPLLAGCAPAVSQQQYSSLQAELNSTKAQLASAQAEIASLKSQSAPVSPSDPLQAPRTTLSSLQPYIELNLLILDDMATICQQNSKDITIAYADQQFAEHRSRLAAMLQRFDDKAFADTVAAAWNENTDPQLKWQDWYQTYSTLRNNLKANLDKLSGQLNP